MEVLATPWKKVEEVLTSMKTPPFLEFFLLQTNRDFIFPKKSKSTMAHELGYDLDEAIKRRNLSKENIIAIRESKLPYVPDNVTDKLVSFLISLKYMCRTAKNIPSDSPVPRCLR